MMTSKKFVEMLKKAESLKTLYVMAGFGAPAGCGNNRNRYHKEDPYNQKAARAKMILSCSGDTFFFDCVGLGKGILWGWTANKQKTYGGATYKANGVPDFGADDAMSHCRDVSTDFSKLVVGEWLWMTGHVGFYVGDGKVIECTPSWENGVQYTKLSARKWKKHGKLKYIDYSAETTAKAESTDTVTCPHCGHTFSPKSANAASKKTLTEIAREVINGKWGNGEDRRKRLKAAGYDPDDVQKRVNDLL